MDTISHTLWGYGLFGFRGRPWLAALFGAMPDLVSFGVFAVTRLADGSFTLGKPPLAIIPPWVFTVYDYSHSLIIALAAVAVAYRLRREIGFAMWAWPFHILLDFPFHARSYFPTKLFFPLSQITFDGIPWSNPWVWFPNLAGIFILFAWRAAKSRGNKQARPDE